MRRRIAAGGAVLALVVGAGPFAPRVAAQDGTASQLIVTFSEEHASGAVLGEVGVDQATEVTPLVAEIVATDQQAAELREHPGVVAVEPPVTFQAAALPNDPCVAGCGSLRTAYLEPLGIPQAWGRSTGAGAEIAVIDGGVELDDPELATKVALPELDYLGGAPGLMSHGTAVAALAAAATDDGVGIPGVARDAMIRSFKVIAAGGTASEANVVDAIHDATNLGVDVINLSLSGPDSAAVHAEIDRAVSFGIPVVAAAGNLSCDQQGTCSPQDSSLGYPARYPNVIAVGAATRGDEAAYFSFRGSWVDVFAPGAELAVPYAPGPGYARFDGTSGAAPIVAGGVALLRTALPALNPAQIRDRLRATSIPLGDGTTGERRAQLGSFVRGLGVTLPPDASPFGSLDVVSAGPSQVSVRGWALDPSTSASIDVHVYLDAAGTAATASGHRPDIGSVLPGYGPAHGFSLTVPAAAGTRRACVYAIDVLAGGNRLLGCRSVVVGGSPVGSLDLARQVPGGVQVSGWSLDPDVAGPIDVHAYAGAAGIATRADRYRSDIGRLYPAWGPHHGYLATIPTSASGSVSVCAYGIDVGAGSNSGLGCRSLQLRQSPFGSIDSLVRSGGQVRIRGWAIDPGVGTPIDVHVYVSGGGAAARRADLSRPDVAAAFPGYGAAHGYDISVTAPPGAQICTYGINVGAGGNALLGCRTAP